MTWIVVAAIGLAVGLTIYFWQQIVTWANQKLAGWLENLFGSEVKEVFLMLLATADRTVVMAQRAAEMLQTRLVSARILFRQLQGGREHEKVVKAEFQKEDGQVIKMEAAEVVPWHELPDDVREKFIRRQTSSVEMELKLKE
jgi:hypothetical protein